MICKPIMLSFDDEPEKYLLCLCMDFCLPEVFSYSTEDDCSPSLQSYPAVVTYMTLNHEGFTEI